MLRLLRHPSFFAVALSHFGVDILNGQVGVFLALMSTSLHLNNATLGLIATLYSVVGSLGQPVFGWASDRFGGRWTTAGGVLWMAFFFALFAVTPGYWPIVCLVVGSLGSAAFHPPGANKAAQVGYRHMAGQAATASSLFFLFGQGGLSLGPALGGFILDHLDRIGTLSVTAMIVPIGIFAAWQLRSVSTPLPIPPREARGAAATVSASTQPAILFFVVVLVLSGLRTWGQMATTTFAPKLLNDRGLAPTEYGFVIALFMGGSAIGGVGGGLLGDRWGKARTVVLACVLSAAPFYFLPLTYGLGLYLCATLAGLFNGAPHSILVTLAQKALPGRGSLASGITLGFMFTAGALGSYLSGLLADQAGLLFTLQLNAAIALGTACLGIALRLEKKSVPAYE